MRDSPWWSSLAPVRFGRAASAVLIVSADYKWCLRNLEYGTEEYCSTIKQIHQRSALRLRRMCSLNGGLFVKVGQHIGSLEYLLPGEYVNAFKVFHSSAPSTPLHRLKQVIKEEFGVPAEELFAELSVKPLGAASLAQCHRGVLHDGRVVAVKIQHPDVRKNAYTDMSVIDLLVSCVSYVFPDFHFQWLAREVRTNLPKELDFCHEARNQEKFSVMYKHLHFIKAPLVYWQYTSTRVLTMEFCEGGKLDDLSYIEKHGLPVDEISHKLGQMYSEMIFQRGYIHCDPHPGNVLIRRREGARRGWRKQGEVEIVLLDHGLYTVLTEEFRMTYCRLWQALINKDLPAVKRYSEQLNAGQLYRLLASMVCARAWDSITAGIDQEPMSKKELKRIRTNALMYMSEITRLLDTVPRQLVLILKTNDLLRSAEHVLRASNHKQSFITMSKYCVRAIGEHDAQQSRSWVKGLYIRVKTRWTLLLVKLYEIWLYYRTAVGVVT